MINKDDNLLIPILLSMKERYASSIYSGIKKYEYRKRAFRKHISHILVYETSPIQLVTGYFLVKEILFEDVSLLWDKTKEESGISQKDFFSYYRCSRQGVAIKISDAKKFTIPKKLDFFGIKYPPQSYQYICPNIFEKVILDD